MQRDDFEVRSFPGIEALGISDATPRLRVAIVTEEILGPVRNGGIASTYYHLAKGLAARGHEVHVLFLKGPVVQDETPEHWVDAYAEFGVTLHYLEIPTVPTWAAAAVWQRRYAAAYEWLRDQVPFDLVHTSEWRGGLMYALMAKRLGLAFQDTLFVVKASSPYIWNRHYQMQPITQLELVAASFAEQRCVELADVVVGGSAHLISFMDRIGYQLPEPNVFVQPNIVDFSNVPVVDRRHVRREPGDVVRTRDLVFFGRLEARKGLELFCGAVDLLHENGEIPESVTFLGKRGVNLSSRNGTSPEDYIREKAQTWSCPVRVLTDRNQPEALSYLCEQDAIAVMPSLIENSSMAIYEALEQRVPFIATAVGGSPELIAEQDHAACLVEPTARAVADRLERALRDGQVIPRARFSNDANLETWYGFHAYLGELIAARGRNEAIAQLTTAVDNRRQTVRTVSYVALLRPNEPIEPLIKAFHEECPDEIVVGCTDTAARREFERHESLLTELPTEVSLVNCLGMTAGEALDQLADAQSCDAMLIADGVDVLPKAGLLRTARKALTERPDSLFTTFFDTADGTIGMPLGSDVASQALTSRAFGPEAVVMRAATYAQLGAFEPYDVSRGIIHAFVTQAAESGRDLMVFPEVMLSWPHADEETRDLQTDPNYAYLKTKSLIDGASLALRKVLLAALRAATEGNWTGVSESHLRGPSADGTEWLLPAAWDPEDIDDAGKRRLIVALDAARDELWFYARGPGERRLTLSGEILETDLLSTYGSGEELVTVSSFPIPSSWTAGTSYPLIWGRYDGENKLGNIFLRVNKIGANTLSLSSRKPVLTTRALSQVVTAQATSGPESAELSAAPEEPASVTSDPIDEFVDRAVTAARQFIRRRAGGADPLQVTRRSRDLLASPPPQLPTPIQPRSGLKSPHDHEGWPTGSWLVGWAWDREERDRVVHVALICDGQLLMMVPADVVDRSLTNVPGRERHGFRIPVLDEFFDGERLHLEIWEAHTRVFRGGLYVDRTDAPMLRRLRPAGTTIPKPRAASEDQHTHRTRRWARTWPRGVR